VPVLIDSGANESFVEHRYVQEARLPLVLLEKPLSALDGHPMGPITHRTQMSERPP